MKKLTIRKIFDAAVVASIATVCVAVFLASTANQAVGQGYDVNSPQYENFACVEAPNLAYRMYNQTKGAGLTKGQAQGFALGLTPNGTQFEKMMILGFIDIAYSSSSASGAKRLAKQRLCK